ncbi:PilZ domain-containing protein [Clostridium felsineum]|uniref:PilZ domain-containing protein n=1 Tax=Clostridium felsineum TaxID=36839 RepID=UPI00098CA534|nr:PilZ domain-containing protein [Clostridium felsineum]URZ01384.1 hypothetical protein CLAUR_013740 [Clostridium felsineum]
MVLVSTSDIDDRNKLCRYKTEKRGKVRKRIELEISYPRVNDESIYEKYKGEEPLLEAVNISEFGIGFKSKLPLKSGDFISFLLSIDGKPSFWCISMIKWVGYNDKSYVIGCEFISLNMQQIRVIRNFVDED